MCSRSPSPRKSTSRRPRASVLEKLKEIKTRVRALPPGGDLEALIHQGAKETRPNESRSRAMAPPTWAPWPKITYPACG